MTSPIPTDGWTTVQSSNLAQVRYDDSNQTLLVKFLNGQIWEYSAVSRNTFDGLLGAKSVGRFLNTEIKGKHAEKKVA